MRYWKINTSQILKGVIPIAMSRLTNQIIFVCSSLTIFFTSLGTAVSK